MTDDQSPARQDDPLDGAGAGAAVSAEHLSAELVSPARIDPAWDLLRFDENGPGPSITSKLLETARKSPASALRAGTLALIRRPVRARNVIRAITGTGLQRASAAICESASRISQQALEGQPPSGLTVAYLVIADAKMPNLGEALLRTIASFRAQDVNCGALWIGTDDNGIAAHLLSAVDNPQRTVFTFVHHQTSAAVLTSELAEKSGAQLIVRLEAGDMLQAATTRALALAIEQNPNALGFYTDEALIDTKGRYLPPLLKPPFCPEYLMAINYTGPFVAVRRRVFEECTGLAPELGKAAWPDLLLRIAHANGQAAIHHIREPLVVRTLPDSFPLLTNATAARQLEARRMVAVRHVKRQNADAKVTVDQATGLVDVLWALPKPAPKVSIIIPTRDRLDLLRTCVEGLISNTDYPDKEIIIVDNKSACPDTLEYLSQLASHGAARILRDDGEFNHSRMNNLAARAALGEVLVLLNNDIEILEPGWLARLAAYALRPGAGATGALLYYPNGTVQHAGIVTGIKGTAGHAHQYFTAGHPGYMHLLRAPHTTSAVTGACLAIRKDRYFEAGGLDEKMFPAGFNDVDLCLKLRQLGYFNLISPHVKLIHHESATRKVNAKMELNKRDSERLIAKWGNLLANDPYYNEKFNHSAADYSLTTRPYMPKRQADG